MNAANGHFVMFTLVLSILVSLHFASPCPAQVVQDRDTEIMSASRLHEPEKRPELAQVVDGIIQMTNAIRKDEKRSEVTVNGKLMEAARSFADYMARTTRYGHTADGRQPAERVEEKAYDYCLVSENIAYQFHSAGFATEELARAFFAGWKNSAGHRKNMLDPDVTETGVAVVRSEANGYYYAVQLFGRPKSQAIEFTITNRTDEEVNYSVADKSFALPPNIIRTHQVCRPPELLFIFPGAEAEQLKIQAQPGDQLEVIQEQGTLRLRKAGDQKQGKAMGA